TEHEMQVAWHDLECGGYRADFALWHELAQANPGPVLEVGAGTGRVALELARAGYAVTALDRDPALRAARGTRAARHDVQRGDGGPAPERAVVGGRVLVSRPIRVHVGRERVRIEREREVLDDHARAAPARASAVQRDMIDLDRLSARQLKREAVAVGLRPELV